VLPGEAGWNRSVPGLPEGVLLPSAPDLHATVAFLGSCGEAAALRARRALNAQLHPVIQAEAAGWCAMGPHSRASAYALLLARGLESVASLIQAWRVPALQAAGRPLDHRRTRPHVTIVHVPRRRAKALKPAMQRCLTEAPVPSPPVVFSELAPYSLVTGFGAQGCSASRGTDRFTSEEATRFAPAVRSQLEAEV